MKGQLEQRLQQLKTERDTGQKMLADLHQRRASLEQTLLRISGAIQVLEELLAGEQTLGNEAALLVDTNQPRPVHEDLSQPPHDREEA
jgi:predicted  nucleic acid-binding Zn-ribbon protein